MSGREANVSPHEAQQPPPDDDAPDSEHPEAVAALLAMHGAEVLRLALVKRLRLNGRGGLASKVAALLDGAELGPTEPEPPTGHA